MDKRSLILFISNAILLQLMLMINTSNVWIGINLFFLGPIFIIAPLYLRTDQFFVSTLLTGFWVDAALPTPFGSMTLLLLCIGSALLMTRRRFRAEKNFHPSLLALLANLIAGFYLFFLSLSHDLNTFFSLFSTSFLELVLSQLALLFIAPWFFNFQRSLFVLFETKEEPESLPFL